LVFLCLVPFLVELYKRYIEYDPTSPHTVLPDTQRRHYFLRRQGAENLPPPFPSSMIRRSRLTIAFFKSFVSSPPTLRDRGYRTYLFGGVSRLRAFLVSSLVLAAFRLGASCTNNIWPKTLCLTIPYHLRLFFLSPLPSAAPSCMALPVRHPGPTFCPSLASSPHRYLPHASHRLSLVSLVTSLPRVPSAFLIPACPHLI
jgi:hypothetical protein